MASKPVKKLITADIDYQNAMAMEKLRKLRVENDAKELDLATKRDELCTKTGAVKEFSSVISSVYAQIRNADEQLTRLLALPPEKAALLHQYMENMLHDLSEIDVDLSCVQ